MLILACLLLESGCSLLDIYEEVETIDAVGIIKGKVNLAIKRQGPVIVQRYHLDKATYISDSFIRATPDGEYRFHSHPGTYYIAAFIDSNKDGIYQQEEAGSYFSLTHGVPAPVNIKPGQIVDVQTITIAGKPDAVAGGAVSRIEQEKIITNIGKIISLDDPVFNETNYILGMWQPNKFIEQVGGGGIFPARVSAEKNSGVVYSWP